MTYQPIETAFTQLFKKYRLRSEIETLSEFGDLLAQEGIVYETSLFSKWQSGERIPKERNVILIIIKLFSKLGGIQEVAEANSLLNSVNQKDLTETEKNEFIKWTHPPQFSISNNKKNVFFFSSPIYPQIDFYAEKIYDAISKLGYHHLCHETKNHLMRALINGIDTGDINKVDQYKKEIEKLIEQIKQADICIYDTTSKSIGTGFLINQSFIYQKPTILLYFKERRPYIFSVLPNELLMLKSYNETNINKVVENIINATRKKWEQ